MLHLVLIKVMQFIATVQHLPFYSIVITTLQDITVEVITGLLSTMILARIAARTQEK